MVQMKDVNKGALNCKVDSDVIAKMVIDLEMILYHVKVYKYMSCIGLGGDSPLSSQKS